MSERRFVRLYRALVASVTIGILGASVLRASASPPESCISPKKNVEATQHTQGGNHQGVKADTWFASANNDCDRVTSLAVFNGSGLVEWGWTLGWMPGACGDVYVTSPTTFYTWQPIGGSFHCARVAGNGQGTFFTLMLKDENSDTTWSVSKDGTQVGTLNVNFDRGTLLTNAERHSTGDSAFAHFKNLKFQVAGSSTFNDFSALQLYCDTDDAYEFSKTSNTEHKVQAGSGSGCPQY